MKPDSEQQFLKVLKLCQLLVDYQGQPSVLPCQAIELLCTVAQDSSALLIYLNKYDAETQISLNSVDQYARGIDNWRVKGQDCSLGFGVKDHCTFLSFFLNLPSPQFKAYTGNFESSTKICEFLKDWKGIDLSVLLSEIPVNL